MCCLPDVVHEAKLWGFRADLCNKIDFLECQGKVLNGAFGHFFGLEYSTPLEISGTRLSLAGISITIKIYHLNGDLLNY